jgi:hypothetical protein
MRVWGQVTTSMTSGPPLLISRTIKQILKWVTIKKFSEHSGYTASAVYSKIQRGDWLEGEVFIYAPDGRVLISTEGFEKWVTQGSKQN